MDRAPPAPPPLRRRSPLRPPAAAPGYRSEPYSPDEETVRRGRKSGRIEDVVIVLRRAAVVAGRFVADAAPATLLRIPSGVHHLELTLPRGEALVETDLELPATPALHRVRVPLPPRGARSQGTGR